jgi:predicted Fe-Mo cluster-binding NifX family protein
MNKIFAISSTGKSEKSFLDLRFGKCEIIVIYNSEKKESFIIDNPFKNSDRSGIQLVNFLDEQGVSVIITGEAGPQVISMLKKKKLQLVLMHEEKIKIEDIITRINSKSRISKVRD